MDPEDRLVELDPEDRLIELDPEDQLAEIDPEDGLAELDPECRFDRFIEEPKDCRDTLRFEDRLEFMVAVIGLLAEVLVRVTGLYRGSGVPSISIDRSYKMYGLLTTINNYS